MIPNPQLSSLTPQFLDMTTNIRQRNRAVGSQPGLFDYIGQGWKSLLDTGSPFLSPNHPAAIASRNIDWDNQDPEYWKSPEVSRYFDTIGSSIGVDPSGFGGGILGTVRRAGRQYKDPTGLLDFRKLETDYPKVPQTREPLFIPQKNIIPDELKIFESPAQQQKMVDWFDEGVKQGGLAWYNTNPLRKFSISEFGQKKGLKLYDRLMRYIGALSPNTAPMPNIKQASFYNYLDQQGVDVIQDLISKTLDVPPGYGRMSMMGVKNTIASAKAGTKGSVMIGDKDIKLDRIPLYAQNYKGTFPATAPKVGRFYENLRGNIEDMATLDAGAMRAAAGKRGGKGKKATQLRESASKEIYDPMEVAFNEFAKKRGVESAKSQAAVWSGSAPYTGVGKVSPGLPQGASLMEMIMFKVKQTADELGMPPKEVLKKVLEGNMYFKGLVGPVAAGGLLGSQGESNAQ